MSTSIAQVTNLHQPIQDGKGLNALFTELLADVTALRATLAAVVADKAAQNSYLMAGPVPVIKAGSSALAKTGATLMLANVNGTLVSVAASTDLPAFVGSIATLKAAAWPFYIDSAGTVTIGTKTADAADAVTALKLIEATPTNKALLAIIVVLNGAGTTWVGGTTALDSASVTTTYYAPIGQSRSAALTAATPSALGLTA